MGMNSNRIKNRATEICESDEYYEAKDEAFNEEFQNEFMKSVETKDGSNWIMKDIITEDDVQGFIDSFTFPDEDEWCMDKACSEADDWGDMKMEEERDRQMGL